jgi:hypothetical protein
MQASDFVTVLRALLNGSVQFIVVGGVAAVLHGAPVTTFDLDIVPSRDEGNLRKLLHVLESLDATYRLPNRGIRPTASHLSSPGHHNLITRCGPLDVLGTIGRGIGYEDLLPHTVEMQLGEGAKIRVADLSTLIQLKEQLGGEKDRAVLPILRRTLEQQRRST